MFISRKRLGLLEALAADAKARADSAQTTANAAMERASVAKSDADAASSAADTAQATASRALDASLSSFGMALPPIPNLPKEDGPNV